MSVKTAPIHSIIARRSRKNVTISAKPGNFTKEQKSLLLAYRKKAGK